MPTKWSHADRERWYHDLERIAVTVHAQRAYQPPCAGQPAYASVMDALRALRAAQDPRLRTDGFQIVRCAVCQLFHVLDRPWATP